MTQTAVDQLIEEIEKRMVLIHFETNKPTREVMILNLPMDLERFKEMEKAQKYKFADEYCEAVMSGCNLRPEQYDNETYGGNK
jgi:hypothetical protein